MKKTIENENVTELTVSYSDGKETESYLFAPLPLAFHKESRFAGLSIAARYTYALYLDRRSLSAKNGWRDDKGVFIYYTIEELAKDLGCREQKAKKAVQELKDIGLVQTVRQGANKPNIIYVMNFETELKYTKRASSAPESRSEARTGENHPPESRIEPWRGENHPTREVKITHPEGLKSPASQTYVSQTELNKTYLSENQISQISEVSENFEEFDKNVETASPDSTDLTQNPVNFEKTAELRSAEEIADKVELTALKAEYPDYHKELDVMHAVICNVLTDGKQQPKFIRVSKQDIELHLARALFTLLTREHLASVMDAYIKRNDRLEKIRHAENYFATSLHNEAQNPKISITPVKVSNPDSKVPVGFNPQDFRDKIARETKKLLED